MVVFDMLFFSWFGIVNKYLGQNTKRKGFSFNIFCDTIKDAILVCSHCRRFWYGNQMIPLAGIEPIKKNHQYHHYK